MVVPTLRHAAQHAHDPGDPSLLRRLLWLALVVGGGALLVGSRRWQPRWLLGVAAWFAAAGWAWTYLNAAVNNERWLPLVLVSYTAAVALVPATAMLAREVWPERRLAPALGAAAAALMPIVLMSTLYFHPDPPFALLAVLATVIVVRALRTGLTVSAGIAAGALLGAAALTRQSAPIVALSLAVAAALIARARAARFLVAGTCALLATAGPWWGIQTVRFGNPLESNLVRPGQMLDHEPASFFVSLPTQLVTHPYSPSFQNELLPRFHAYLWSDWGGNYHHWGQTKAWATTLATTQSVLGFGGDALVLVGVVAFGLTAVRRVATRSPLRSNDAALTVLTSLFLLSWGAFVEQLVRYPWRDGDTIKVHYLLYLAPVSVVFAIASGTALVRRGGWRRALLLCWLALYTVSWALTLVTAF